VTDEQQIRRVLAQYCHHCDDGDFDALLRLFAADAELVYGERFCRGRAEVRAFFEELQGTAVQRGKHITANGLHRPLPRPLRSRRESLVHRAPGNRPAARARLSRRRAPGRPRRAGPFRRRYDPPSLSRALGRP
jgi:SnoaL-like domain